ncbi:MAG: ABC transporter permease subunit [Actinobacteria bacterium]|jgi:ABC-2 type transport system permease protein|nr:ABC transporter permease subunit [Actinomycetota bacterium]
MNHISREFFKLLLQKRTYFGWVGLFIVPFLITTAIRLSDGGGPHHKDPDQQGMDFFFNVIESNGLYVAVISLFALAAFLLPLLASMAGSQTIAGEAEKGTLRTVLMQPVRRGALLMAKWLVANAYVAVGLVVLAVASIIAGGAFFGLSPMLLFSGETTGVGHSIWLIFLSYVFVWFGMVAVVSVSVALSTLTDSGLTAMAAGLALVIVMIILGSLPVFDFLQPYLFTTHFDAWTNLFNSPIDWGPIRDALINFAVWIIGMTGIAYLIFRRKDILS